MEKSVIDLFDRLYSGEEIDIISILGCSKDEYDSLLKQYLTIKENERLKEKGLTGYASIDRPWEKYYSNEVLNFEVPRRTIYRTIYENNYNTQNRVAISYYGNDITYKTLFEKIDETTKSLIKYGVKKGDYITLCLPTTPETIYLIYAISRLGAIANLVDPRTSANGIEEYINECDSKLLFVLDPFYDKIKNLPSKTAVENIVTISASDSLPFGIRQGFKVSELIKLMSKKQAPVKYSQSVKSWNDFILSGTNEKIDCECLEHDKPTFVVHTGGTTGTPKGVLLSDHAVNCIAYQYKLSGMHLIPGHKFMNIMPPFIAYGVGCGVHMPLTIGMTTIPIPQFDPKKFPDLILKHQPNHTAGVPSQWEHIIKSKKMIGKDLSFWITPAVGGDKMDVELERKASEFLQEHNAPNRIIKGYGITEECSLATACINSINKDKSVGIPLPQNIVSVFEEGTDRELKIGERGEICLCVQSTMLGYLNNQKATNHILKLHSDGKLWIHTQDLGYMDEDGFLYIDGRYKRMIVRYDGFKVFPSFIEDIVKVHPAVKSCCIVGKNDEINAQGQNPYVYVVLNDEYLNFDSSIIEFEIMELCKKKIPEYAWPVGIEFISKLPVTSIGKIDFVSLEKRCNEQQKLIKKS